MDFFQASHLDASAAAKLVLNEPGSGNIRRYFANRASFVITSVCLAEALGVLKRKLLKKQLTQEDYFGRCGILFSYVRHKRIHIDDIDLATLKVFLQAEDLARRHGLDMSDSLQLVSIKYGKFRHNVEESKTILITADRGLASAANAEGLRVWNCQESKNPPNK